MKTPGSGLILSSPGMVCSVGYSAAAACAALRANVARLSEMPYLDSHLRSIVGGYLSELDEGLTRRERVIEMLASALEDCLGGHSLGDLAAVPLLVGTAEAERPGGLDATDAGFLPSVEHRLGMRFHPQLSRSFPEGQTATARALVHARDLLRKGLARSCLVAGVDSLVNSRTLRWLEEQDRLKTEDNPDGIIPGEAAAALWVEYGQPLAGAVVVDGIGFGDEPATAVSDQPLLAVGLAGAARAALTEARCGMHEVAMRISDVSGEPYSFREQALTLGRLMRQTREQLPLVQYADSIGEAGAAAGTCELVIAWSALTRGYAPGDRVACYTSALGGKRAVMVVRKEGAREARGS